MSKKNKKQAYKMNQYDKLVVDIRNNLITRLDDLMSKLLNSAQEKLFNLSDEADSNEEQTRYFDLMNQIRLLKANIAQDYTKQIKDYLVPAKEYNSKHIRQETDDDVELSLVGQDEMEGIVLVKGIGERAAAKYREQLSHLEARLEHLATKTDAVFKNDVLTPTNLCQAFDNALSDNFNNANKKLLFGMFDVEVTNKLDALYDSINNRLIDAGILPQIKLHTKGQKNSHPKPKPSSTAPANIDKNAQDTYFNDHTGENWSSGGQAGEHTNGTQSGGGSNIGGFAMTAVPGAGYRHTKQQAMQSVAGEATDTAQGSYSGGAANSGIQPGDKRAGGANASSANMPHSNMQGDGQKNTSGGGYQHYTAGMPASQVGRVLGNYIGGAPITPSTDDETSSAQGEFFPDSTPQHFGHQEIIHALSGLQQLPQFSQPGNSRFDGEAVKQAVLTEIAKTSGGAVTKRINTIAEKTIDFIELIFDAIIDDEEISDTIKTLLLRLQIPVIKASMSDQEFFIYDDHPARVLLDTIADVGVGITEHADSMFIQLDKVISNILGEHNLTTKTFQKALDGLITIIEKQEIKARTAEEEAQQQLLRKHARSTVLKALRATTTGKSLPDAVHPLILKRWPTLMFNHYLGNGKDNNEWVNLVLTLRHIVVSVQPVISAEQLAKLLADKDELFERTESYLNIASASKKDVRNIMGIFEDTVQLNIDDANFTEEEVTVAEEEISQAEPVEEALIEEETDDKPTLPSSIMPGMWFQLHMGEGEVIRRCKLSVIIVEDANLMFVNHKGELVIEKSFDEFNDEIANDKSKAIMGHSAFDHAFKAVINELE
ncbi:hypothetical protein MNBD_GAMMA06-1779 [hydrothermal vent metagenome]|uniref:Thymidine phosphorylase n=1 Tax=hydrothermal vent metagenome TaxID=652676 RepID=A0A3B0X2M4_9ZZZZ